MGLFGSLIRSTIDVITTPVAVIKDVATLGGAITDKDRTYTEEKLRSLGKNLDKAYKELDDL